MIVRTLLGAAMAATLFIAPAQAQLQNWWRVCREDTARADDRIEACTSIIRSKQETQKNRGIAHVNRGNAWRSKRDYDRAIDDHSEAIRLNPRDAIAYNNRGLVHEDKRQYDQAFSDYDQAIRIDPKYAYARSNRGDIYHIRGDYDRAIADYDQAIKLKGPRLQYALTGRGNSYRAKGDLDRALADFNEAIRINPRYASAYADRGLVYAARKEYDRAIAEFNDAIKVDPKFAGAYVDRGNAWRNKGDKERAIADYNEAIRLDPKNTNRVRSRGYAYFAQGDFTSAAADMLRAVEARDEIYPMLFRYLARARGGQNATAELEANATRLRSKAWPYATIELYVGRRSPEATVDAAVNVEERCEAEFYIGQWHLVRGEREQARPRLQKAIDSCPKSYIEHIAGVAELKRLAK